MLPLAVLALGAPAPQAAPTSGPEKRELGDSQFVVEPTILSSTWSESHAVQQRQQPTTCGQADLKTADWCERKVAKMVAKGKAFELPDMSLQSGGPYVPPAECYDIKPADWCAEKIQETRMVEHPDTNNTVEVSVCLVKQEVRNKCAYSCGLCPTPPPPLPPTHKINTSMVLSSMLPSPTRLPRTNSSALSKLSTAL
jgi:hypothetical protein